MGVEIDEKLNWEKHVETICKKASAAIGAIRLVNPFVPADTLQTIYNHILTTTPLFGIIVENW